VTVNPAATTVKAGFGASFSAVVTGQNNPSQNVTWTLSGATAAGTAIATDGRLTVDVHETAATLTVTATSVADPTKTGSATVTVQQPSQPAKDVIDKILALPDPVRTWADADIVAAVTNAVAALSASEKAEIPQSQLDRLTTAQTQAGPVNRADTTNGATITTGNLDWNIRLVLTPIPASDARYAAITAQMSNRKILALYDAALIDTLTGQHVQPPIGQTVTVALTKVPLAGATNVAVIHQTSGGAIETVPSTVSGTTVTFTGSAFSPYGVTADKTTSGGGGGGGGQPAIIVNTGGSVAPSPASVPVTLITLAALVCLAGAIVRRRRSIIPE